MHAVLLLSATLHVATLGLLAAFIWRRWLDDRRPKEPSFPETVGLASAFAGAAGLLVLILTWLARPFGTALMTGIVGGVLAGLAFLLALAALPARPSHGLGISRATRLSTGTFLGVFIALELVVFCLLAAAAGSLRA